MMETALIVLAFLVTGATFTYLFRGQHLDSQKTTRLLDLIGQQNQQAQDERREMVSRLQFPDRMPARSQAASSVKSSMTPEQRKAFNSVGTVAAQLPNVDALIDGDD